MKKLLIIALTLVFILSLAACDRKNRDENNTTVPTTENSILPEMDPTMDTNVPDPDVQGAVPDGTNGMDDMLDDMTNPMDTTTVPDSTHNK